MDAILTAVQPALLEIIGLALTAIIGWLARVASQRWGLEIEARHREALHQALMSGARAALDKGAGASREVLVEAVLNHVKDSVPGALRKLKPGDGTLWRLAETKLAELAR